jgi:DNA-binding transcriptional ArsR family regulator
MEKVCVACFKALSTPARFEIFERLKREKNGLLVSELVGFTKLRQPTVSFHVNELVAHGLAEKSRRGREVCCRARKKCRHCPLFAK